MLFVGSFVSDVAGRLVGLPDTFDSRSTVAAVTDKEAAEFALEKWNQIRVQYTHSFIRVQSLILIREPLTGEKECDCPQHCKLGRSIIPGSKCSLSQVLRRSLRAMSTTSTKNKSRGHWGTQIPMHSSPSLEYLHSACQSSDDSSRSS